LFKVSFRHIAEDLVQETFIAAHQSLEKFNRESSPETWFYAILNNKIKDYFRKETRNIVINESQLFGEEEQNSFFDTFFDENGAWKKEMRPQQWDTEGNFLMNNVSFVKIFNDCLDKLPSLWNKVVNLKYLEQKKGKFICQETGLTSTNYWQILHRARVQLRECLEENWFKK
jgi:RNA polymerase sigma-70 factor (ECF subfamily)